MSKKLQQTLTGAMAAMMATGVVATPVMAATTDVDAIYKAAYTATMKALTEKTQAAVNEARTAIKALPANLESAIGEFSKQVDTVQHPILVNIVKAITLAQTTPNQANINAAKKAIPAELAPVWKNSYSSAVDKAQQELQGKALEAVKKAETSRKAEDVEAAKALVADVATADSQAIKDFAEILQTRVEAVKLYDLEVTKATLSADGSGVTVEFTALKEALRDVTLEVIDGNGKLVEVTAKSVLIESETAAKFTFKNAVKVADLKGIWKINGLELNQNKVNLVNDINTFKYEDTVSDKSLQSLFDTLNDSKLVTGLVDKLTNHNQYYSEFKKAVADEKIKSVEDIQKVINSANNNVGTEVKASDLVKLATEGTLSQFTTLFNKANFSRVNADWIEDYKASFKANGEDKTISELQKLVDSKNEEVALNVFNDNADTLRLAKTTNKASVEENLSKDGKLSVAKIEKQIAYVEEYVVVDSTDSKAVKAKANKLQALKELLAVADVTLADTQTSLKAALKKLETVVNNKKTFEYDKYVNESLVKEYVEANRVKDVYTATNVLTVLDNVQTIEEIKAIAIIGQTAIDLTKELEIGEGKDVNFKLSDSKLAGFLAKFDRLQVVTAKTDKFVTTILNKDLVTSYLAKAVDYGTFTDEEGYSSKTSVENIVNQIKGINGNVVGEKLKGIKKTSDAEADKELLLEVLNDAAIGLTNVVDNNVNVYYDNVDAIIAIKDLNNGVADSAKKDLKKELVSLVDKLNALATIKTSSDVAEVTKALNKIALTDSKVDYINLTNAQKSDIAELVISYVANKDNAEVRLLVSSNAGDSTTLDKVVTAKLTQRGTLMTEVNGVTSEATKALKVISKEFKNSDDQLTIAGDFYSARFTKDSKGAVVENILTSFTEVRELLAKVMK